MLAPNHRMRPRVKRSRLESQSRGQHEFLIARHCQWFRDLQRVTISVENAVRLARMFGEIDVAELLPQVTAPTLVMHSRHDARVPFEQGLLMAREIPNTRFVALDSPNHIVLSHEPAWQRFIEEVCGFLKLEREVEISGKEKTHSPR